MNPQSLLLILLFLFTVMLGTQSPIPQSAVYHAFADQRAFFLIPNFWNVISNLPFALAGIYGILVAQKNKTHRDTYEIKWLPFIFSWGILAVSIGSAYYHWNPNNNTLVLDRLPMTVGFMSLFTLVIYDFCNDKIGRVSFWAAHLMGINSIVYWVVSENIGKGDLRPYILVQFFPIVIILVFLMLFPSRVNYKRNLFLAVIFYALAKVSEHLDKPIYDLTNQTISGHPIKHLLSAIAVVFLLKIFSQWRISKTAKL